MTRRPGLSAYRPVVLLAMLVLAGCSRELVVLLPDEGGAVGELGVMSGSRELVLDSALAATEVGGLAGARTETLERAAVEAEFADALDAQPPAPRHFTLYFREATTVLMPESRVALSRLLAEVRERAAPDVQVTGHTDRLGTVEDNDELGQRRAVLVRALLIDQGLDPGVVRAVSRGERELAIETDDGVREPRNRRAEVTVR